MKNVRTGVYIHNDEIYDFSFGTDSTAVSYTDLFNTDGSTYQNAKVIWDFLKYKGLSDAAAAGVLGNIQAESNFKHDYVTKMMLYQMAGVKEYWIVDPKETLVYVYDFENIKFEDIQTDVALAFQTKVNVFFYLGNTLYEVIEDYTYRSGFEYVAYVANDRASENDVITIRIDYSSLLKAALNYLDKTVYALKFVNSTFTDYLDVNYLMEHDLNILGMSFSPIKGPEGNREYLVYFSKDKEKTGEYLLWYPPVTEVNLISYGGIIHIRYKGRR